MEERLNEAAGELMRAARAIAEARGDAEISGAHVLLGGLRHPFPTLSAVLRPSKLRAGKVADQMEELLTGLDLGDTDVPPFARMLAALAEKQGGEVGPEVLVRVALAQNDPGTAELVAVLKHFDAQLVERLASLAAPPAPGAGAVRSTELRSDSAGPRVALCLNQAQTLAQEGQINTRLLVRVCLSDVSGFLSKGLLAVGAYENVLRAVGGKVRLPPAKHRKFELHRCTSYLQSILQRALDIAVGEGQEEIDERSLTLALIADAREDATSDLASLARRLRDLEAWVEKQAGFVADDMTDGEVPMDQIVPFLQSRVINQDHAIKEVYRPILRVRLGLGFEDALAAVLLFVGPPGVGKSYLAKLMAEVLYGHDPNNPEAHFVMVECGRYKDSHAVTDLIGAPHGYIGSDKGILRDGVRDKYPCVIVFDEAERMNVAIWDALLTMFNDGVFRDNEGARYTLKDCVVVLTSNKGIEEAEDYRRKKLFGEHATADALVADAYRRLEGAAVKKAKAGPRETLSPDEFWSNEDYRESYKAILLSRVREHFGPALYSRIDEKMGFNGLREVDYVQIAANAVQQLTAHLESKTGVRLWSTPEVAQAIAGALRSQVDASARDINRFVRKYILDDAFAPLKLKELEDKTPLAPAYQIKTVLSGPRAHRVLDHFELVPTELPQEQP